jgi:anion-transporting  ArsA/GET3 family ATPase
MTHHASLPPTGGLHRLLDDKAMVVVCGSGGVGKTTTAAAMALMAAVHTERKVLVLTVDPARRLADALRLERLGNQPVEIDRAALSAAGEPKGRLFAAMLDTKQSWDDLVRRHAPDEETRQAILGNPLYKNITDRFVQSHDYIAMERLHELHEAGEWDLIVVDTPPAAHAVDFLDAPARMADFFDSKLLRFLVAPSRSRLMSLTAKPFLQIADRLLGQRFLADISEFFARLETMRPGFIERAQRTEALLRSAATTFVVVSTLEHAASHEASRFIEELRTRSLDYGGLVLNRTLPSSLLDPAGAEAAGYLRSYAEPVSQMDVLRPAGIPADVERVLRAIAGNHERFAAIAQNEERRRAALAQGSSVVVSAPWFDDELHDVAGLSLLGGSIWS